jgi:hypothetical protein
MNERKKGKLVRQKAGGLVDIMLHTHITHMEKYVYI